MKIIHSITRIVSVVLATVLLIVLFSAATVHAAASTVITVSGNTEVGSTIKVNISVKGDGPYSGYNGSISYDPNFIALTGIVQGNYPKAYFAANGSSFLDSNANIPNGGVLVTASFTCLAAGSTTISCSIDDIADINVNPVTVSGASKALTITTPVPKSSNADLASLAISPGTLSPEFSTGTLSYSATVDANQSKIAVSAAPSDSKSKVSLNGVQNKLVSGANTVKITVTAENGATKVYTIAVTRSAGPTPTPSPTPVPLPLMKYNGVDYTILQAGTADAIPEGFKAGTAKYQNVDIPVLQKTLGDAVDASVINIVLLTANGQTSFFVYNPANESCYPYLMISSTVLNFQILDKSAAASTPAGYEAFDYTYNGATVSAFRLISDPSNPQIMLYLMDAVGISAFYYYDTQNQMLMLYRGSVAIAQATATPIPTQTVTVSPVPTTSANITIPTVTGRLTIHSLSDYTNPVVLVIYLLVILCLVLLVVCIVLIVKKSRPYDGEDYADYEDIEEEYPQDNTFEDSYSDTNEKLQQNNNSAHDSPYVAKQPDSFFSEFNQPVNNSTKPVQPVSKPVMPSTENKLYFGDNPQDQIVQDVKEEHVPVRLRHELEAELTHSKPDASQISIPEIRRTDATSSTVMPTNTKRTPASTPTGPKLPPSDPDFDPDDE